MGQKQLESSKLKYILKILKTKQQVINDEYIEKKLRFSKYALGTKNSGHMNVSKNLFFSPNETKTNFHKTHFSKETIKSFEE